MAIPPEIHGQKYASLISVRKNGAAVPTPVWFGEKNDRIYVVTSSESGKYKRVRNHPQIRIAPCTFRGRVTGPEFAATVRILPPEDWPGAARTIRQKYWLARFPFFRSRSSVYLEIEILH
jgi:uncharacterized protein